MEITFFSCVKDAYDPLETTLSDVKSKVFIHLELAFKFSPTIHCHPDVTNVVALITWDSLYIQFL